MGTKALVRPAHGSPPGGVVHPMPKDFRQALGAAPAARAVWEDITPLARNEWICWVISGKKSETRDIRIKKGISKLRGGMRRPCCWSGCMHRTDKPLSPSQKFVYGKRPKNVKAVLHRYTKAPLAGRCCVRQCVCCG